MSDSTFNADQFLGTQIDGAGQTKYYPCPVGEYMGQVNDVTARQFTTDKGTFTVMEVRWAILDDDAKRETQQDNLQVRQTLFLDMTPAGGLDLGRNKNVPLSRLRDAVGQNRDGRPWQPSHLKGQTAKVKVVHRPDQNGDPQAEVTAVTTL